MHYIFFFFWLILFHIMSVRFIPLAAFLVLLSSVLLCKYTATVLGVFIGCTHSMWKFLGQGLNSHHHCNPRHSCSQIFFFFLPSCGVQSSWARSDVSHSQDLSSSCCGNSGSLTHCASWGSKLRPSTPRILPIPLCCSRNSSCSQILNLLHHKGTSCHHNLYKACGSFHAGD